VVDDISVLVLEKFAEGNWRQYEDQLNENKINVEECLNLVFQHVKAIKNEIIDYIIDKIVIRDGFENLVKFCERNNIEFTIISAGLDFVIDLVLGELDLDVPVVVARTHFDGGLSFSFPSKYYEDSEDFKADTVRKFNEEGFQTIFIGDAGSDYHGALHSKFVFAVKDKPLELFMQQMNKSEFYPFTTFDSIISQITSQLVDNK
ncbi:MAG: HAD-IB family phosphatase, partial [Candidatus Heimdallarchaeota archaeon]